MPFANYSYPDALVFREIFEVLSKIVDEVNVEVTHDGIIIRATDPAQIAYIQVELPSIVFSQYKVDEPGDFGLIVSIVNRAIKSVKRGQRLDTFIRGDEIELTVMGAVKKTFIFKSITVPKPELNLESLVFKAKIVVLVETIKNALKDIELVSDKVVMEQENGETFSLRGAGETKYGLTIPRSSGAVIEMEGDSKISSSYNVDYLVNVLPLLRVSDTMTLEFIDNGPLKITIDIPTGGKVTYLLAPYIG